MPFFQENILIHFLCLVTMWFQARHTSTSRPISWNILDSISSNTWFNSQTTIQLVLTKYYFTSMGNTYFEHIIFRIPYPTTFQPNDTISGKIWILESRTYQVWIKKSRNYKEGLERSDTLGGWSFAKKFARKYGGWPDGSKRYGREESLRLFLWN